MLWGSWAVIGPRTRFWFGGDTGYCEAFKQIGDKYGPFDMAAIPIGAYQPNWFMKYQHVHPGMCYHPKSVLELKSLSQERLLRSIKISAATSPLESTGEPSNSQQRTTWNLHLC